MVLPLPNIQPKRVETDIATKRHHHRDVAPVGHRSVKESVSRSSAVEAGVGLGHHDDPFAWLNQSAPFEGRAVH